jgi:curli production assembly/transport component CsgE
MTLASARHLGCYWAARYWEARQWRWLLGLLLSLVAGPSWGQRPAQQKITVQVDTLHKPLSTKQMEEALRLLLRADSVQQARVVQPGMEADAEGFVLDQTISKPGRDFYELFYGTFQSTITPGLGEYTIVLTEKPLRGNSSFISMSVNDSELLEMPLPTRTEQLEAAVASAVETARDFLAEQQATSTQMETVNHGLPAKKP